MGKLIKPLDFNGGWNLSPAKESIEHIDIKKQYQLFKIWYDDWTKHEAL